MLLPALYHWSPTERRDSIWRTGLQPGSDPVVHSGDLRFPYLCLAPTPSSAWGLSGDMEWVSEIESWDLWMVRLGENAEVRVMPFFGNVFREVRVYTPIPGDALWYVATRTAPVAK